MPQVTLQVGLSRGQTMFTLPAHVDSGADASSIPINYLKQMQARPGQKKWLRGVAGGRYEITLYTIFLQIGPQGFYVPVVGDELFDEVIVGRDVLNQMIVTLNGLAGVVEIS